MDSSKVNSTCSPVSVTVVLKASAGKMRDFMGHGAALIAATLNSESHHRQRAGRRQPCVGTGA